MGFKKFLDFGHAWDGILVAWREEKHFKLHVNFAVFALLACWAFRVTPFELLIVIVLIGLVMTAELINTALEELCDKFSPTHDPHIGKIKDLSAAAVFTASLAAFVTGVIIFLPYFAALT